MNKLIQKLTMAIASVGIALFAVAVPVVAHAQTPSISDGLNRGTCLSTTNSNCTTEDPNRTIDNIIKNVINIFSLIVGVVSVIMIIIGGLKYITSGGESGSVSGAKNTIMFAVIGLIVVALAQVIVKFVLKKVSE
jgi:hypothetical protein